MRLFDPEKLHLAAVQSVSYFTFLHEVGHKYYL